MSMVELLIAMTVMAIGISGILALVLLAIASNNRSKTDSTGTMLAQWVIEQAEGVPSNGAINGVAGIVTTVTVNDCANTPQIINMAPGGANTLANGQIDWSQAPGAIPAGYQMNFAACAPVWSPGGQNLIRYDVRWAITQPYGTSSKIIVVSARPMEAQMGGSAQFKNWGAPVTLRTIIGQ
jgi:Tfp pilus assembly protein PilV